MFADPQSVTIDAVPISLPRVSVGDRTASYSNDDGTTTLTVSHVSARNGRVRRLVRIDVSQMSPDPFIPANQRSVSMSAYLVIDEPEDGTFTNAEVLSNTKGLVGFLTDANLTKVIAGES